ncbi:fanconi-associated nuclease 1 isoform X2 [Xenopus tropicalis]|nr:fanconi-associated nuclease 1 isoform X2 [Xenopus tropicalis]|eukprot:XP_012826313.1 PREDICTED: fanconi-associated nuclease 1 isoform X2 [Xenopus tropicalis]
MNSPEKKKSRRSLSISKKKPNVNLKNIQSPRKTSVSPSIIALFKNAPPAKLSCPLCAEMVPRFGLNKHLDETCQKAKQCADDVILIEEQDSMQSEQCQSTRPLENIRNPVSKTSPSKNNEKQTSSYFNKCSPVKELHKETEMQIIKTVPLGSLSSKLSRRRQVREMKQEMQENNKDATGCCESLSEDLSVLTGDQPKNNDISSLTFVSKCEKKTDPTDTKRLTAKYHNQSDVKKDTGAEQYSHHLDECLIPTSSSVKSMFLGPTGRKQVDKDTKAKRHNSEKENTACKRAKHCDLTAETFEPALAKIYDAKDGWSNEMEDKSILDEFLKPFNDPDSQEQVDSLQNGMDANIPQESSPQSLSIPYYQRNFLMVLQTVMESEEDMSLFSEEDIHILRTFYELSGGGQKLYVRLFQRKLNWLKINKIEYPEIASDLVPFIEELVRNGFLQSDSELQELSEALDLLSAPELKLLAKAFHLANPNAQKQQLAEELLRLSKQRSVFSLGKKQPGIAAVILKKAKEITGRAVRVCKGPRGVFSRVLLLFSLTESMDVEEAASGGQTQLSTVLMVNMGRMTFPEYTVQRSTRIFNDREDLIRYESAMHKLVDVAVAMTSGQWEEAHLLYQLTQKEWDELKDDPSLRNHEKLPEYLRCFTVGWIYTKILSRGVEILQRLHLYKEAVELLRCLLSQKVYCPDSRGRWWDRLALNLHQHLKRTQEAIGAILEGLSDPHVRTGHQLSLYQRAVRMRDSPSCKKFRQMFCDLPLIEVEDVPHVTIKGKMYPQTGMGKSVFIMEELSEEVGANVTLSKVMCSVEELSLAHYRQQGFDQGIHGEGSTFFTLYGLLLWDIIFMEGIPDVFRNSYQAFPLDLYTDSFYENRREAIECRLQLLQECSTETLSQLIADVWNAHEGKVAALVNWERFSSLQQAQSLVSCLGGAFLSGVCKKMSRDIRHCKGGLPDLVVWNGQTKQYKLVEVKGPNDRLSHKQIIWLHELQKLGASVEVCHVVSIGAKSNRVA